MNPLLDVHSAYVKQSLRNRYEILGVNGRISLTLPVESQQGQKIPLKDIRLAGGAWPRQHLGAIRSGYGRSAFFEYYIDEIQKIYSSNHQFLLDFSLDTLLWYRKCGIQIEWQLTTEVVPYSSELLWDQLEPSFQPPANLPYLQVFSDRHGFTDGLSCLDLIMNKGPEAAHYLQQF